MLTFIANSAKIKKKKKRLEFKHMKNFLLDRVISFVVNQSYLQNQVKIS